MARTLEPPEQAKRILGHRGRKLHTHELHIRRTANKGYIARHDLRDSKGQPPDDGQRGEAEYAIPDQERLLAHVARHMGPPEPPEPDEQEPEPVALADGMTEPAE